MTTPLSMKDLLVCICDAEGKGDATRLTNLCQRARENLAEDSEDVIRWKTFKVIGDYKLSELTAMGRSIWGNHRYRLDEILVRLQVGIGDIARCVRNGEPQGFYSLGALDTAARDEWTREVKKELGNVIVSTIRWCDDLGFNVTECVALAIEAQRKFAASGKSR